MAVLPGLAADPGSGNVLGAAVSPHVTWNAYYGFDGEVQSGRGHWHPIEFQPNGGGRFGMFIDRFRDRPLHDFVVYSGVDGHRVVIPPGLYHWTR